LTVSEREPFDEEQTDDGIRVFFYPAHYSTGEIEAELPDGSRVPSTLQQDGRLGFEEPLPAGTWIPRRGVRTWGPIGSR
jgi:hypothetical protein